MGWLARLQPAAVGRRRSSQLSDDGDLRLPSTNQQAQRWSQTSSSSTSSILPDKGEREVLSELGVVECTGGGFVSWH